MQFVWATILVSRSLRLQSRSPICIPNIISFNTYEAARARVERGPELFPLSSSLTAVSNLNHVKDQLRESLPLERANTNALAPAGRRCGSEKVERISSLVLELRRNDCEVVTQSRLSCNSFLSTAFVF
jgi:hypothetical protein